MYPLADRALGGTLERRLRRWRKEGRSYEQIARAVGDEGIDVSGETIRKWVVALGIDTAKKKSAA